MKTRDFDYELPSEQIAQTPVEPRDASRLMVVDRASGQIEHRIFRDVGEYLRPGDLLVLNQTRVIPARLFGRKAETGGRVELLLLKRQDARTWETLARGKKLRPGTRIELHGTKGRDDEPRITAEILARTESGGRLVQFEEPIEPWLDELGVVPLPPYIHEPLADPERYQTIYGQIEGSVAASTAGLHFTPELLVDLRRMGVETALLTLHIGLDTFRPVKEERVEDHQIHTEWYELTAPVAGQINRARLEGRRVIAVGTTVVRALESAAGACAPQGKACGWQTVSAYTGPTDLFIYPGYRFRVVEAMITNFHLPRSTLLLLVSAFASRDLILRAYEEAIGLGYRFFSFGDAMLLL
ncbi:MAG: tRNA preQ1(34) S-adenosylmethionine ribosyltransferase-isomerase QueA [Anaerolineae bacterium]|jgi:S-adenosylmethionine:tRNA ribosyltransferase-isomerase